LNVPKMSDEKKLLLAAMYGSSSMDYGFHNEQFEIKPWQNGAATYNNATPKKPQKLKLKKMELWKVVTETS